jgi:hypothetical protein
MEGMNHGDMKDGRQMRMEWRTHMLMRVLVGLIVLIFVFWLGMQLGELRNAAGLDHGMMMGGSWGAMGTTRSVTMHTMIPAGGTTTTVAPATGGSAQN